MGLDKHLQASVTAGLIDKYRGASNYLNEKTNLITDTSRVLVLRIKARRERLNYEYLSTEAVRLFGKTKATHVVVDVTYGAAAYCVLTPDLINQETRDEVSANLSDLVRKILNSLEDRKSLTEFKGQFNKEEKQRLTQMKCRLYADLQTQVSVKECNVFDAYNRYLKLMEQVQQSEAVPISVLICPLKHLIGQTIEGSEEPFQYRDVDADLLIRCNSILSELELFVVEANTLLSANSQAPLRHFVKAVSKFQEIFKKDLKIAVVKARETSDDGIQNILDIVEKHPLFEPKKLKSWLEYKKTELKIAERMGRIDGITILASKKEVEDELSNSYDSKHTLVMWIPPLDEKTNEILKAMTSYVESNKKLVSSPSGDCTKGEIELPWYMDGRKKKFVNDEIRKYAKYVAENQSVKDKVHFFLASSGNCNEFGCRYSIYKADTVLKDNFEQLPDTESFQMNLTEDEDSSYEDCESNCAVFGTGDSLDDLNSQGAADEDFDITRQRAEYNSVYYQQYGKYVRMFMSLSLKTASQLQGTKVRFAEAIIGLCEKICDRNGLDVYSVPLTKSSEIGTIAERFYFGEADGRMQRKTILLMGATGSGKTTLINAMINYIFDVQWEDNFRFQLIQEQGINQSHTDSQTSKITVYDIHHQEGFRVPYSVTIVDTPIYGDTKRLGRDEDITKMIRTFFEDKNGIQELDTVGFVAPALLTSLTSTHVISDSVLSVFGDDIKENINFLITFADRRVPHVLKVIVETNNLSCLTNSQTGQPLHHKFNNSELFGSNRKGFNKFYWDMGITSFNKFFNELIKMKSKSLSLKKEVLEERKTQEATVDGLQPLINIGLARTNEIMEIIQMVYKNQAEIDNNRNVQFEYEAVVARQVLIPDGMFSTNCNKCKVTCHYPCSSEDVIIDCCIMDKLMLENERCCTVCPGKCLWTLHASQSYRWEYVNQKQPTSLEEIKNTYESELNTEMTLNGLIQSLQQTIKEKEKAMLKEVEKVTKCIARLEEIALRPNPLSSAQYIGLIIDTEKKENRPGFDRRILSLEKLRNKAEHRMNWN